MLLIKVFLEFFVARARARARWESGDREVAARGWAVNERGRGGTSCSGGSGGRCGDGC